ncbi:hypothetical protein H2248_004680 [Termitomyces sp. 'cryptogamus']|nr:hypothetical protein H2248_004680 [Termitomyces sp. 'cryptogamus']
MNQLFQWAPPFTSLLRLTGYDAHSFALQDQFRNIQANSSWGQVAPPVTSINKRRKNNKDMISESRGFVYVSCASDFTLLKLDPHSLVFQTSISFILGSKRMKRTILVLENINLLQPQSAPREIITSLATLYKAVSARIYFENLLPVLSVPTVPRVTQALEKGTNCRNEPQSGTKGIFTRSLEEEWVRLHSWTKAEEKIDASAFVKLKTTGHGPFDRLAVRLVFILLQYRGAGAFGVVSLVKEQ